MNCINCDEPASKCGCDPAVLRDAWEDRAVNAEARVKELEAESRMARSGLVDAETVRAAMEESMERMRASARPAGERIAQLEADLAKMTAQYKGAKEYCDKADMLRFDAEKALADALKLPMHALVADVLTAAVHWDSGWISGEEEMEAKSGLERAVAKFRAANITIQHVRTYTREEAEAVYAAVYGAPTRTKEKEILVNALMGVPVPAVAGVDKAAVVRVASVLSCDGCISGCMWCFKPAPDAPPKVDHLALAESLAGAWQTREAAIRHIIAHLREKGGA